MKRLFDSIANLSALFIIKLCFKISASMLCFIEKLPFTTGVSPEVFFLTQWVDALDCFSSRREKIVFALTRIADALTLTIRYGLAPMLGMNPNQDICHGCDCDDTGVQEPIKENLRTVPVLEGDPAHLEAIADLPSALSEDSELQPVIDKGGYAAPSTTYSPKIPESQATIVEEKFSSLSSKPKSSGISSANDKLMNYCPYFIHGAGLALGGDMEGGYVWGGSS